MVDLLQQYSIKSIINPYPVEWVHPKCLRDNSIGCKLLSLALEYADESVLRVLVEHEITKGTTAKACSSQDLTVESFFFLFFCIALHLSRIVNEEVFHRSKFPLYLAAERNDTEAVRVLLSVGAYPGTSSGAKDL